MPDLVCLSPWHKPLGFFEEFRELSERSQFSGEEAPDSAVAMTNPVCGDSVWVWLDVEGDSIQNYAYRQQGCWPVVGCLELWGLLLPCLSVSTLLSLEVEDLMTLVAKVPTSKRHAFSLTLRAVQMAAVQSRSFPRR